ncbi:MAG: isochorismatase family protein, partial [Fimbriimonadales bacterium]
MAAFLLDPGDCVLVMVDLQTTMLAAIENADAVVARAAYLARCARLLGVPVLATEQIPEKLGPTAAPLTEILPSDALFAKASFSCARSLDFMDALRGTWRKQVVLAGVEAHICVLQTALDLRSQGFDVTLAADACGSRNAPRK